MVGNGHPMGVAAQILQDLLGTGKGALGKDDPLLFFDFMDQLGEVYRRWGGPWCERRRKTKPFSTVKNQPTDSGGKTRQ